MDFVIDFQFKSHLLDHVANSMFHEAATRMMGAFESRVHLVHHDDATPKAASVFLTGVNRAVAFTAAEACRARRHRPRLRGPRRAAP